VQFVAEATAMADLGPDYWWDLQNAKRLGNYLTRTEAQFISSCLEKQARVPIELVLDVGAGSGRHSQSLVARGVRVLALETNLLPLQKYLRKEPRVLPCLVQAKSEVLPLRAGSVDCVLCIEVLNVAESRWFWQECGRILRDGGIVVASYLNKHSYKGLIRRLTMMFARNPPAWRIWEYTTTPAAMRSMIAEAGLISAGTRGLNWVPFNRHSNSRMVSWLVSAEQGLGLTRLPSISPWVLLCAKKE
jgi:2-polyprenyl-3-methyl-5-hydroxy-6-metoxy-1,4-benzoquinol methylase